MKKLLLASFVAVLMLTACSKKAGQGESNTMLPEPENPTVTSTEQPAKVDSTKAALPAKVDSASAK